MRRSRRRGSVQFEEIGCLGMILLFFGFIGFCVYDASFNEPVRKEQRLTVAKQEFDAFGHRAEIVGFQLVRSGTKPANYRYHDYVIVKNEAGERKRFPLYGKPAVIGEVWSLTLNETHWQLGSLIEEAPRAER